MAKTSEELEKEIAELRATLDAAIKEFISDKVRLEKRIARLDEELRMIRSIRAFESLQ